MLAAAARRARTHDTRPAAGRAAARRDGHRRADQLLGPPPSEIDRQLVGPVQLLRSGKLDRKRGTIRLPLYLGHMRDGRNVWYILTDRWHAPAAALAALGVDAAAPVQREAL